MMMAKNGMEALELIKGNEVDIIVSDVMMPEMDGFDVLGFMKRSHMTEVIPVIMISSESSSS